MDTLTGVWLLTGTHTLKSQVPFVDNEPAPDAVGEWLDGSSDDAIEQMNPASGLRLTIRGDGTFSEEKTGVPEITWYDSEGVLDNAVIPFGGTVKFAGGNGYLMSEESEPSSEKVRYDDGDTKIADSVAPRDGKLLRTVSVVTDELYLDRILLRYEREG